MVSIEEMNREAVIRKAQEILDANRTAEALARQELAALERRGVHGGGTSTVDTSSNITVNINNTILARDFQTLFWEGIPEAQRIPANEERQVEAILSRFKRVLLERIREDRDTPPRVREWLAVPDRIESLIDIMHPNHSSILIASREYLNRCFNNLTPNELPLEYRGASNSNRYFEFRGEPCGTAELMTAWRSFDPGLLYSGSIIALGSWDQGFRKLLAYYYLAAVDRRKEGFDGTQTEEQKERIISERLGLLIHSLHESARAHSDPFGADAFSCIDGQLVRLLKAGREHPATRVLMKAEMLEASVNAILDHAIENAFIELCSPDTAENLENRKMLFETLSTLSSKNLVHVLQSNDTCSANGLARYNTVVLDILRLNTFQESRSPNIGEVCFGIGQRIIEERHRQMQQAGGWANVANVQNIVLTPTEEAIIRAKVLDIGSRIAAVMLSHPNERAKWMGEEGDAEPAPQVPVSGQRTLREILQFPEIMRQLDALKTLPESARITAMARVIVGRKLCPEWTEENIQLLKREIQRILLTLNQPTEEKEKKESEEQNVAYAQKVAHEARQRARLEEEQANREAAERFARQWAEEEDRRVEQERQRWEQQRIALARAAAVEQQRREAEASQRQQQAQAQLGRGRVVEGQNFSYEDYFESHPDVRNACHETDPLRRELFALRHYIEHGRREGRPFPGGEHYDFSYEEYLARNPDVRAACGTTDPHGMRRFALQHYINDGRREGRVYPRRYFSHEGYFEAQPDVRDACRATEPLGRRQFALQHYIENGIREGRTYPIQQAPRPAP